MQNKILKNIKPEEVFNYFEEISKIPRGSGNEKGISNYLKSFVDRLGLEAKQDDSYNIVIKKPGTAGYENEPSVILQGHMDMVCEKNIDINHDFLKDPIKLKAEGDRISAEGTTLGADDGIAVAMIMAVLSSDTTAHPPIEALFTTGEEVGLIGAGALDKNAVKGKILINLDSEEEGKFLVSCAGGRRNKIRLKIKWIDNDISMVPYYIKIRGLKGGHSGAEINKGRANSIKLAGRILIDMFHNIRFDLWELSGGSKNNAIPRNMDIGICVDESQLYELQKLIDKWNTILKNEFRNSDPDVNIILERLNEKQSRVFSQETKEKSIKLMYLIPDGINTMSMDIPDLVESSTNLGIISIQNNEIHYDSAVRSSVRSLKDEISNKTKLMAETFGAEIEFTSDYPEWQYKPDSKIRDICVKIFQNMYNKKPEIVAIHGGVECGLFREKFGDMDMISFGPDLFDVHTPNESMSISSVERTWEFLVEILKEIKQINN